MEVQRIDRKLHGGLRALACRIPERDQGRAQDAVLRGGFNLPQALAVVRGEGGNVTLPMAKARGFSAERHDAERLAGCPPERAGVRMDGQHTCEWSVPRLLYPLAACPAERPEHATGCAKCTGPKATPHGVIARAHTGSIARVFEQRKRRGPFTPMPEGRGPPAPKW